MTYYYGFTSSNKLPQNKYQEFFKKESRAFILPEYSFDGRFGDTIFYYKYKQNSELMIMKVQEFNPATFSNIKLTNEQIAATKKDISEKINIVGKKFPYLTISFSPKLKKTTDLKINFDGKGDLSTSIFSNNYVYWSTNFNQILIYNKNKLEMLVGKLQSKNNSDFMMLKYNDAFYLMILYPLSDERMEPDALLNIIEK